jgi:formyl-CoA transferase/CoA:oxalate CoA-transferase
MFAVQGILAALYARERLRRGQRIDVAMLDAVTALLTYQASSAFATGATPSRMGNRHPSIAPYDTFDTADGPIVLAVGNDDQWQRFCQAAALDHAASDPRFLTNAGRVQHGEALRSLLAPVMRSRTRADWTARLVAAGVPAGPVRPVNEALADPQLAAREMLTRLTHAAAGDITVLGVPVKLSDTPGGVRSAPPILGEHTDSVLAELGYDATEIASLRHEHVV